MILAHSSSAGLFWVAINELLSSFLYWFKTDRYATVRWKNAVVAETAARRYGASSRRIKNKILSYYDDKVCFKVFLDLTVYISFTVMVFVFFFTTNFLSRYKIFRRHNVFQTILRGVNS